MADSTRVPTPPRPRLRLRLGVTGHRRLPSPTAVAAALERILDALEAAIGEVSARPESVAAYAAPAAGSRAPLVCLSGLAAGADSLVAERVRRRGGGLQAVLPFAREEFEEDFRELDREDGHTGEPGPALAMFRDLLADAEAVFVHDGRRRDDASPAPTSARIRDRSYEAVGRTVLRHCDILVAVWDGAESRGRGGTGQIVDIAARQEIPILWIHARDGTVRAVTGAAQLDAPPPPLGEEALTRLVAGWAARVVAVPWRGAAAGQGHGGAHPEAAGALLRPITWLVDRYFGRPVPDGAALARFYAERVRPDGTPTGLAVPPLHRALRDRVAPAALADAGVGAVRARLAERMGVAAWAAVEAEERAPSASADGGPAALLRRAMRVPDAVAVGLSEDKRSATLLVGFAAAVAIMCAAASLVFSGAKAWLATAELLLLLLVFALVVVANVRRWKDRWLAYRLLAELLRVAAQLAPLGRTMPVRMSVGEGHVGRAFPGWVSWYFDAMVRDAGLAAVDMTRAADRRAALIRPAAHLMLSQIDYHRRNALRTSRLAAGAEAIGEWSFIVTLVLLLMKLALLEFGLAKELLHGLTLPTVWLPTLAAAAYAIRHVEEWALLHQRSDVMAGRMERWL
ncbi:MAG: hypothetical protein IT561_07720, partial [Alphaproteobacteria bacterium]|nr:hypothetical protein [Alphaproteobacteria bacterium]